MRFDNTINVQSAVTALVALAGFFIWLSGQTERTTRVEMTLIAHSQTSDRLQAELKESRQETKDALRSIDAKLADLRKDVLERK